MQWEKHLRTGRSDAGFIDGTWKERTLGLTSRRAGNCGQTWSTNFFITPKTIKANSEEWNVCTRARARPACASLMPIDLFFEAPCPMDSCNFMDVHPPHTHDVRWYNIRLYSTYVRWNRIMHYPTHEVLMFVTLCLLLWSHSRRPVAFSKDIMLSVNVGDKYRRALIHSFIHSMIAKKLALSRGSTPWRSKWSPWTSPNILASFGIIVASV